MKIPGTTPARVATLAALLATSGCGDATGPSHDPPPEPRLACPSAPVPLCASANLAAADAAAIDDAATRLAPALTSASRESLAAHLAALAAHLRTGDVTGARNELVLSRALLRDASTPADATDADAIALALQESAAALALP